MPRRCGDCEQVPIATDQRLRAVEDMFAQASQSSSSATICSVSKIVQRQVVRPRLLKIGAMIFADMSRSQ